MSLRFATCLVGALAWAGNYAAGQGTCPSQPLLGSAGAFNVLGLAGASVTISEGGTTIAGDVGLGPHDTGALLKATIKGMLLLDPTATPDIHPDLTVLGGTSVQDLSSQVAAALGASSTLAALPVTQTLGPITTSTTINSTGALNVVQINGGVNIVKGTLAVTGGPSDVFVFNVTGGGGFNFSSSQMVLSGVSSGNIIWNFIGGGSNINIFKSVTVADGIFLAPMRNEILDSSTLNGNFIAGGSIDIHSAATVNCPQIPQILPQ